MTLVLEQSRFLQDVCKLIAHATEKGFVVTGGELERRPEMQEIYSRPDLNRCAGASGTTGHASALARSSQFLSAVS